MSNSAPRSVMQIIHSNEGGGVEALAGMIGAGLRGKGCDVETTFLYPRFTATRLQKLAGIARAARTILRKQPDVIIAYQSTASVLTGVVGYAAGCKLRIVHQTATPAEIHPVVRVLDKIAGSLGLYSVNIANSATTADAFSGYPRPYRRTMRRIDHGLDAPQAASSRSDVLLSLGVPDDGLILVTTGRLCEQKAQDRAIRALTLVPRARLLIAGGGPDETSLKALADDCGVANRVHFLGVVPHDRIGDLLGAADVFVFTTRWETFGLAAVEAAMSGAAIVASDIPILREVLSAPDGNSPVAFVDTDDAAALAAAIEGQRENALKTPMLETFRDVICEKYSKEKMLGAYRALISAPPLQPASTHR